MAVSEKRG